MYRKPNRKSWELSPFVKIFVRISSVSIFLKMVYHEFSKAHWFRMLTLDHHVFCCCGLKRNGRQLCQKRFCLPYQKDWKNLLQRIRVFLLFQRALVYRKVHRLQLQKLSPFRKWLIFKQMYQFSLSIVAVMCGKVEVSL